MKPLKMIGVVSLLMMTTLTQCEKEDAPGAELDKPVLDPALVAEGKEIFRFDTFGDEGFWTGLLHIDKAILGESNGGFGTGVSPTTALSVGLKVDAEALPASLVTDISAGQVDLNDPATTVALLKLDAVVGLKGSFDVSGNLISLGVTCAICHSTVDDSFAQGIGKRLDGWPNRDLNTGAIISLTDNAKPVADLLKVDEATLRTVLAAWGPGKYDAVLFLDGKATLREYQLSLNPPVPPVSSYDQASADLGEILFTGKAKCASCHKAPIFADNVLHTPEEMGIDDFEASRSPTGKYRTTPLRGLFARTKGGFFHDGRFATLNDVVNHYNDHLQLDLTQTEKDNLVEYLKSI